MNHPEKLHLAFLPTPIVKLEKLSKEIGKEIYMKRDDMTGLECSGNKVRKLEYVLKEALDQGFQSVITCGGIQSNHCRATAALAARLGLKCILFLRGEPTPSQNGNLLLNKLFGAEICFLSPMEFETVNARMASYAPDAYQIPLGASTALGAMGYVDCYSEITAYERKTGLRFDAITLAVGSGGTYAGLLAASQGHAIIGFNVSDTADYFTNVVTSICVKMNAPVQAKDVRIIDGYVGQGYGIASKEVKDLIGHIARTEGLVLDPVYTGKAFYGLVSETFKGTFEGMERILFIHTGGLYGLFSQGDIF